MVNNTHKMQALSLLESLHYQGGLAHEGLVHGLDDVVKVGLGGLSILGAQDA